MCGRFNVIDNPGLQQLLQDLGIDLQLPAGVNLAPTEDIPLLRRAEGTATVDFGGAKNGGTVVGIVDGFVYLGAAIQSLSIGALAPVGEAAKDPNNWSNWPLFLMPWALVGCLLSMKIWNAAPKKKKAPEAAK